MTINNNILCRPSNFVIRCSVFKMLLSDNIIIVPSILLWVTNRICRFNLIHFVIGFNSFSQSYMAMSYIQFPFDIPHYFSIFSSCLTLGSTFSAAKKFKIYDSSAFLPFFVVTTVFFSSTYWLDFKINRIKLLPSST